MNIDLIYGALNPTNINQLKVCYETEEIKPGKTIMPVIPRQNYHRGRPSPWSLKKHK